MQQWKSIFFEEIAHRISNAYCEAVYRQDIDSVVELLLAHVVNVHFIDWQDKVHAFAVYGLDLSATSNAAPQHAEFAGIDGDYNPVEEENYQERQHEQ